MSKQLPQLSNKHISIIAWACLICIMPLMTGCGLTRALIVQTAPTTEKVAPEFNRLPGKKVLVYVWAPPEIRFDYPKICYELSAYVSAYLQQYVEDVQITEPVRIENYIEKKGAFQGDPVELGKHFRADMVVHLSVYKFSIRDPGYAHYYRGRINSSVAVRDFTNAGKAPEAIILKDVAVVVPEKNPIGFNNVDATQIRQATYDTFAVEVGKKFHVYERPVD